MFPENSTAKRYWYSPQEDDDLRSKRRLQDDLGVDETAAEVILSVRKQVIELQAYIRQLEAEVAAQKASQQLRLARYRKVYFEAAWVELEFQK